MKNLDLTRNLLILLGLIGSLSMAAWDRYSNPANANPPQMERIRRVPTDIIQTPTKRTPSPQPTPTPAPQPTSYRVKMWLTIVNSNDGAFDNTIECYGELRIDGELYWQIPRTAADNNQREAGQTLEVSNSPYALRQFIFNKPQIDYVISLRDADGGSPDDDVYQGNRSNFNLAFLAGKGEQVFTFVNRKTFEQSVLHIRVEPN
jgi:hypothetical protein